MRKILPLLIICCSWMQASAQVYDSLLQYKSGNKNVYYSSDAKESATSIAENVLKAEKYFKSHFHVQPEYTLLILNPSDWKKFAHPNAIYGIPHFLPDGRLVVASENNDFWRRNLPPLEKMPKDLAKKTKEVAKGEVSLQAGFNLLAIHELGHAFQKAANMNKQRNWLSELLCNVLLHAYIAENDPKLLPALTLFLQLTVKMTDAANLKYTKLEDFETYYGEIAQKHPDNYGWYQCRFHISAGEIYDVGGVKAMVSLWNNLLLNKEKLSDTELTDLLSKTHPAVKDFILKWSMK